MCPIFMKFGTYNKLNMLIMNILIGIDDYEYSARYWWPWPKIIDSSKFGLKTEIRSDFCKIWHSQQTEHANYEYNIRQCLEGSCDCWFRMIIGSEWL